MTERLFCLFFLSRFFLFFFFFTLFQLCFFSVILLNDPVLLPAGNTQALMFSHAFRAR